MWAGLNKVGEAVSGGPRVEVGRANPQGRSVSGRPLVYMSIANSSGRGCVQVVFRYALALLKYKEAELLRLHDTSDIYHFLRFFPRTVTDSRLEDHSHTALRLI